MASDSCIGSVGEKAPFGCIKVFSIPIRIRGPIDTETGAASILYDRTAGFCFSGSFLTAYFAKETISEVLYNAQALDQQGTIGFERIAKFAFTFYVHLHEKFKASFGSGMAADFILAGFCDVSRCVKVYAFSIDVNEQPQFTEILTGWDHSYHAIGSADWLFKDYYETDLGKGGVRVHFGILERINRLLKKSEQEGTSGWGAASKPGRCAVKFAPNPIL